MRTEVIAKICHEANKAYCEELGDTSQLPWEYAPDWQRQSIVNGVKFHMKNPEAGPGASHANWLKEKFANDWKYGPVKDEVKKEHPCCVPFEFLPKEQQRKDELFIAIVRALWK